MSRQSYHHGDLAQALEHAAMELLNELPAEQISLREVARRTDVSHSAPLHHFGNRRGLLNALVRTSLELLIAELETAVATASDAQGRAEALASAYLSYALEHPHAFNAIYDPTICVPNEPTPENAPLLAKLDEIATNTGRELAGSSATTALDGETAQHLGAALWASVHGVAVLASTGHLNKEEARRCLQIVVSSLANTHM